MATSQLATRDWEGIALPTPGTFDLDVVHTTIGFVARHMMVSKVRGRFGEFSGSVTIAEDPLESTAEAVIKTASVDTGVADRDAHLRSEDFFAAEKFPEMIFRTTRITGHSGDRITALGELTIRDVTKEIELKVEYEGFQRSPWGQDVFGFAISAELDREAFGLTWNQALEAGGVMVGKKIKIEIEGEAIRRS
ncbi:YceI family protein [Rhizohabitans arisaemae]|uniref:YceI family protein n=1 Tax=Rhizohabitans arisaemae TaxID=2720610 RepID=UPI0024B11337|nr:YceI family protein [Rhizohabitans arisaemae]